VRKHINTSIYFSFKQDQDEIIWTYICGDIEISLTELDHPKTFYNDLFLLSYFLFYSFYRCFVFDMILILIDTDTHWPSNFYSLINREDLQHFVWKTL
jgi:hypothetical protein